MVHKYKVSVKFEDNDKRRVQAPKLHFYTEVHTNNPFKTPLFHAELFKELAYGECEATMLATDSASGRLSYFDYYLLDNLFNNDSYTLAMELMNEFEIEEINVFNPFGEPVVSYSKG